MTTPSAILVTGGAGFIGSHACKALHAAGFNPVSVDNLSTGNADAVRWGPLILADVRDRAAMDKAIHNHAVVAVMHFAASAYVGESMVDPAKYHDNNIGGMIALLDVCRSTGIDRLVLSSSCATYGLTGNAPIIESTPQQPINPYGRTKLICEQLLLEQAAAYGLRMAILRYFNAAGADPDGELGERHSPETHLIPLALLAAAGKRAALDVYGTDYDTPDGSCVRDYIHVDDLARAHVMALSNLMRGGDGLVLNLGSGRGVSVLEVASAVQRVTGRAVPMNLMARRLGDPPILIADCGLAARSLGFQPRLAQIDTIIRHAAPWFGHEVRHADAA